METAPQWYTIYQTLHIWKEHQLYWLDLQFVPSNRIQIKHKWHVNKKYTQKMCSLFVHQMAYIYSSSGPHSTLKQNITFNSFFTHISEWTPRRQFRQKWWRSHRPWWMERWCRRAKTSKPVKKWSESSNSVNNWSTPKWFKSNMGLIHLAAILGELPPPS